MDRTDSRKRYREIALVLSHHGFEWLWSDWGFGRIFGRVRKHRGTRPSAEHTQPEMLRLTLEQLGTTFIKVGQLLSTRPDLVPHDYVAELSKLQDQAPEVAYVEIAAIVEREFGRPP